MFVKDIRELQYGKIHEVWKTRDEYIVTTLGVVLWHDQYELLS